MRISTACTRSWRSWKRKSEGNSVSTTAPATWTGQSEMSISPSRPDETRDTTDQLRLTRIGTHAVSMGLSASLWNRLRTHRRAKSGTYEDGGNHRGSVFRKRVGEAMIDRDGLDDETHPGVRDPARAGIDGWRSCRMNGASASTSVTSRSSGLMSTTSPAPRATARTSNGT